MSEHRNRKRSQDDSRRRSSGDKRGHAGRHPRHRDDSSSDDDDNSQKDHDHATPSSSSGRGDDDRHRRDDKHAPRRRHERSRSRSQSPRYSGRHRHSNFKPRPPPQRQKLFQQPPTSEASGADDTRAWGTKVAAIASDDTQRAKFEALLGLHKKPKDASAPALTKVVESEVAAVRGSLNKMQNDLDSQYGAARAFTHQFRGRGL